MGQIGFDCYDEEALLERLGAGLSGQDRQVVFVVGSGLTAPAEHGAPGVPGVDEVIELIEAEFSLEERLKLSSALDGSPNRYQEAFKFLLGRRGPRSANGIIKKAVSRARYPTKAGAQAVEYAISATTADEACREFDNDFSGWYLTPGVEALGRLAAMQSGPFGRMIVTTNFDPLIGAAIATHGSQSFRTFLHRDGSLSQADGPGTHVVHLHGYWYGSDTLHTPQQLGQERPMLRSSLSQLLRANIFVVMAYGGWDDAFTQALMSVALEDSSFPEIIWCFRDEDPSISDHLQRILSPGISRGRVTIYGGINAHTFLPKLADHWSAPRVPMRPPAFVRAIKPEIPVGKLTEHAVIGSGADADVDEVALNTDQPPLVEFLVGRDEERRFLLESNFKVGSITGFGGQGKSALAADYFSSDRVKSAFDLRLWRDCREQSSRFEDHIVSILEGLNGGVVRASELARQSMSDLAELFVDSTSKRPTLIVFDNVDHYVDLEKRVLVGAAGKFIERFSQLETSSRILLTCRPPVRGGEDVWTTCQLQGLDLVATEELFKLRGAPADTASIATAHETTQGHAFWLDLLAAQVAKRAPDIRLEDLLQSINEGSGEIPDATLRSIWNSLRNREQVTLQGLAEVLRPSTMTELADYLRHESNYKNIRKAIEILRDLNLVVVKEGGPSGELYELHPLIKQFIQKTFPRSERQPFILAILRSYAAYLAPFIGDVDKLSKPDTIQRCLEAAELCVNADRLNEAIERLKTAGPAVRRHEPPGEFVRIAQRLFGLNDLDILKGHRDFEAVYETYVKLLANLGHVEWASEALEAYEKTLDGKDARYIHLCDMQCYLHWVNGDFTTAVRWGVEGEELASTGVDTPFSTAHNLALAQRDSGAIDAALKKFLQGTHLSDAIDPEKRDVDLGGHFYGNIGRCLHLMGQIDTAISCYRKSALLIEDESEEDHLENQAYVRQWLGELMATRGDADSAVKFYRAAVTKWSVVSPPKARQVSSLLRGEFGLELVDIEPKSAERFVLSWIASA